MKTSSIASAGVRRGAELTLQEGSLQLGRLHLAPPRLEPQWPTTEQVSAKRVSGSTFLVQRVLPPDAATTSHSSDDVRPRATSRPGRTSIRSRRSVYDRYLPTYRSLPRPFLMTGTGTVDIPREKEGGSFFCGCSSCTGPRVSTDAGIALAPSASALTAFSWREAIRRIADVAPPRQRRVRGMDCAEPEVRQPTVVREPGSAG